MTTAGGLARVTTSRKDCQRSLRSWQGSGWPWRTRCLILFLPALENGWQGGPPARSSTSAADTSSATLSHVIRITQVPVQGQAAEVMPVRLDCFGIAVNSQNHTVPGSLKPEAQAAGPAEEVRCQVRTFGAQPGCIGQKCVRVCAFVSMRGQPDERPPHQLDPVVPSPRGLRRALPHTALQSQHTGRLAPATDKRHRRTVPTLFGGPPASLTEGWSR